MSLICQLLPPSHVMTRAILVVNLLAECNPHPQVLARRVLAGLRGGAKKNFLYLPKVTNVPITAW